MSETISLYRSALLASLMVIGAQGCAMSIVEGDVFRPNVSNQRSQVEPLTIDKEDQLPSSVTLKHQRITTTIGSIAVTFAETKSERLVVHCGGNASDRKSDGAAYLTKTMSFGDVIMFDYPGYGDSEGSPNAVDFEIASSAIESVT